MRKIVVTGYLSRGVSLVCAALVVATVIAACDSGGSDDSRVASLSGSEPESTSSNPTADDSGRPQLRLDSSEQEKDRLRKAYYACLAEHGHRMYPGRGSPVQGNETAEDKAAKKACLPKKPLRPPQLVREKNPHYLDDYHKYIKCLHDNGMNVQPIKPFGTGWKYGPGGSSLTAEQRLEIDKRCKIAAFGDG